MKETTMSDQLKELVQQLEVLLRDAAAKFVQDNIEDAAVLGEDAIRAIFAVESFHAILPEIPVLGPDASLEQRAVLQEILAKRSMAVQLVAKAEKQDAQRVAKIRNSAMGVAGGVAKAAAGILGGVLVRALIGG